jgi:hypothetical protein
MSDTNVLADTQSNVSLSASLAAAANPLLIERLAAMSMTTDDPEQVRRTVETFHKLASPQQGKQELSSYQPVNVIFDFSAGVVQVSHNPAPPVTVIESDDSDPSTPLVQIPHELMHRAPRTIEVDLQSILMPADDE